MLGRYSGRLSPPLSSLGLLLVHGPPMHHHQLPPENMDDLEVHLLGCYCVIMVHRTSLLPVGLGKLGYTVINRNTIV